MASNGVAGRTDYSKWDKVTTDLVTEVEKQEKDEVEEQKKALGLDGKYARSQAEAEERAKLSSVKKARKVLETYKKRESSLMQEFPRILGPVEDAEDEAAAAAASKIEEHKATEDKVVRITRDQLDAGKRVITICDTSGASQHDTIVLTQDLSLLESKMAAGAVANVVPKEYPDDAENTQPVPPTAQRSVNGIIKLFIQNVRNCTIIVKCKVISGTVELSHCRNVVLRVEHEATVATIQADLCQDIHIEFRDAPSGKNIPGSFKTLYWGEDKDDRIFHAGVKQMKVTIYRDGFVESERVLDYIADGATTIGNASAEEYQFVTSVVDGELVTEKVVRAGATTGKNARAMTERELEEERVKREKAADMAVQMAEDMIKITTKSGEVVKATPQPSTAPEEDDVEEVYTSMTKDEIKAIVDECEHNKRRGNEAFEAGEYAQAILLYSLALDKAHELPDNNGSGGKSLFPRHILLCNRSACFLKLGEHEKALTDATKAQEMDPTYVKAHFRRGLALHAMGRFTEALPILGEAHKLEPKNQQIKQALQFAEVRHEQEMRKRMQG